MIINLQVDLDGSKWWYKNETNLHREGNHPAVIYANGEKSWYLDSVCIKRYENQQFFTPIIK